MQDETCKITINTGLPSTAKVVVTGGEKICVCRCWQSKKFPYCDGSHKTIEGGCCGPLEVIVQERQP